MFYYYGRKKKLVHHYPPPDHRLDTIIEPFAGSAAYALHGNNWTKRVILVEKDPQVAALWRWLIHEATPQDIRDLPDLKVGDKTSNFLQILHSASKRAFSYKTMKVTPVLEMNWGINKHSMIRDLPKVKHWEIIEGDYTMAPDVEATWFIDPPYQGEPGTGYDQSSSGIDYTALGSWCQQRKGEIIVCEGRGAAWLPFQDFVKFQGVAGKDVVERMHYRGSTELNSILDMFG